MFIVAVDGPSGSGKGTISAYLSESFQLKHIDSGLLYRFGGFKAMEENIDLSNMREENINKVAQIISNISEHDLAHPALRTEEVASAASKIAVVEDIRSAANTWMHRFVRDLPLQYKGIIVDGRDIGTVVFPNADVKLFITADEQTRLLRRYAQSAEETAKIQKILQERDIRDSTRKTAPLLAAKDAEIIDTTHLSLDETCRLAAEYVSNKMVV